MTPSDRRMHEWLAYEALMHEDAELGSEDAAPDPRLTDATDAALVAMIDEKLGAIGERRLARARAERLAQPPIAVRPGLLAMVGAELRAYLRRLEESVHGGQLAAAHRNLDEVSDDDVRSLIADLEALAPGAARDGDA